jgi:hypothetical protein
MSMPAWEQEHWRAKHDRERIAHQRMLLTGTTGIVVRRTIRLFDDASENQPDSPSRAPKAASNAETVSMTLEDAQRWKILERRARNRGWTIDLLEVGADRAGKSVGGTLMRKLEFALVELSGNERTVVTGDLDTIEAFL